MREKTELTPAERGPEPITLYCTLLAWSCCVGVVALLSRGGGWWVMLSVMGLVCLSFLVSLAVDVRRLERWSRPGGEEPRG